MLPVKGGPAAKSRLLAGQDLPLAIALDTIAAVAACRLVASVVVVSADAAVADAVRVLPSARARVQVIDESRPGAGLVAAVQDGVRQACAGPTAVLLADLPALGPDDLVDGLDAAHRALAAGAVMAVVPDASGVGSVLLAAAGPADLQPHFGADSLAAHRRAGAQVLTVDLPRLRQDVDTPHDLRLALALGAGPRTRAAAAAFYPEPMQATVHRFDVTTGSGSMIRDDGVVLPFDADAFDRSGLRHLRVGQRLDVETAPSGAIIALRLGTIAPVEG